MAQTVPRVHAASTHQGGDAHCLFAYDLDKAGNLYKDLLGPRQEMIWAVSDASRAAAFGDYDNDGDLIKAALERRGLRIEDFDAAIAAHALALGATLVTANVEHMGRVPGLRVEDWSE